MFLCSDYPGFSRTRFQAAENADSCGLVSNTVRVS